MIRVAFRWPLGGAGWLGGDNYLWNLLFAIRALEAPAIAPVVLVDDVDAARSLPGELETFVMKGPLADPRVRRVGNWVALASGRSLVDEYWVRRARADLLSHGAPLGRAMPWIFWIADLQHRRRPEFFGFTERKFRDRYIEHGLGKAAMTIVSSQVAYDDLLRFYPKVADRRRMRVLRFVSQPRLAPAALPSLDELRARHRIPERYFHLPNQFWKHKNHATVVEALAQCPDVTVVATGANIDYRHPDHYESLMARAKTLGLQDRFRHLGVVEFRDLIGLMKHSIAVINPSLFEGWSTTVEEARSLGKRILLSDIDVHREQDPARGWYFSALDAGALAALMRRAWEQFSAVEDAAAVERAAQELPARTRAFAEAYQAIAISAAQ